MTETTVQSGADVAAPVATAKKGKGIPKKKAATKTASKKATHPPTSQMVTSAIRDLKERGGSSLQAIKKYISTTYKIDAEKISFFIRKYIKAAVESGELVQTKGKGAAGSFRLGGGETGTKKKVASKKPAAKKAKSPTKPAAKKTIAVKTKKAESTTAAPTAKKTKKPPTSPKVPKPKKSAPVKAKKTPTKAKPKKPAAKKASPKKK